MKDQVAVKNPWQKHQSFYGYWREETWNGYKFLACHSSVVVVKDGIAITECVTVEGAIRRLKFLESLLPTVQTQ
jgi:hypothetical protein